MSTINKFKGRVVCTRQQFDSLIEKDPNKEYLITDDDGFVKANEQNTFTGQNTFTEETQFNKGISSDGDITVTNSVVKVLDNTDSNDIVTQYGADEIVKESGTGENKQTYNYKYPDKSGTIALESDIAFQEYESFIELTPNTAVNGTLTEEQFNNLTTHDDIGIKLNNEYYRLTDGEHTPGLRSYTHTGWNGDSTQDKSINITISTKAWALVLGKNKCYRHYVQLTMDTDKTFYYDFSSTQEEPYTADTLPIMKDNTIALFSMLANGYYSNVSGVVYRSSDNVLKAVMHGMYTDNGISFTYLNLSGAEVTFNSDTVVKL